ncbi:MAG: hypothetical protein IPK72_08805 [Candidatus Eisenbacteria bacterium]|nr:hypothetical protein [Candidatus Eisenbacteria bacterium]
MDKAQQEYARVEARAEAERRALEKRLGISLEESRIAKRKLAGKRTAKKVSKKTAKKVSKKTAKKTAKSTTAKRVPAKKAAKKVPAKKTAKKASKKVPAEGLEIRVGAPPMAEVIQDIRLPPKAAKISVAKSPKAPKVFKRGKLTYKEAQAIILASAKAAKWDFSDALKVPHMTAPGGRIRFYVKPRAIYADYAADPRKPQFSLKTARSLVSEGEVLELAGEADPAATLLSIASAFNKQGTLF